MKLNKTIALAALVASGLFAGSLSLQAQDNKDTTPPPAGGAAPGVRARPTFDTFAKNLELTDEQKPKVKPIWEEFMQKQKEVRQDTNVPMAEKRTKVKELRDATTAKLKDILTADQLAKWEKQGQGPRQRPQAPAAGGAAAPEPAKPEKK